MGEGGRVVIPAEYRKTLGLKPGHDVILILEAGVPEEAIRDALQGLSLDVVPFEEGQAYEAGLLRTPTKGAGLSLGDRGCLSLALKLDVPALTADRTWEQLTIGAQVKVIR